MIEIRIFKVDTDGTRRLVSSHGFPEMLLDNNAIEPEPMSKFHIAYFMLKEGKTDNEIIEAGIYPSTLTLAKKYVEEMKGSNKDKEETK